MKEILITICATTHYYGTTPIKCDMVLKLKKDPENPYDGNAISANLPSLGIVGYVANSSSTLREGTSSASEIYNVIENEEYCKVIFKGENYVIAKIMK